MAAVGSAHGRMPDATDAPSAHTPAPTPDGAPRASATSSSPASAATTTTAPSAKPSSSKRSKTRKSGSKKSSSKASKQPPPPPPPPPPQPPQQPGTSIPTRLAPLLLLAPALGLALLLARHLRRRNAAPSRPLPAPASQQQPAAPAPVKPALAFTSQLNPLAALAPAAPGPLSGLTFAAADDVPLATTPSGLGLPTPPLPPAPATAPTLAAAAAAGATLRGKTTIQEFSLELLPTAGAGAAPNPLARKRSCGAGSIGAALATSGGLVDFALAPDAIGGLRLPAACCGCYAFRPSPTPPPSGIATGLSICAQSPGVLLKVAAAAASAPGKPDLKGEIIRIYVADDLFRMCDEEMRPGVTAAKLAIQKWAGEENVGQFNLTQFLSYHLSPGWRAMIGEGEQLPPAVVPVLEALRRTAVELYTKELREKYGEAFEQHRGAASVQTQALMDELVQLTEERLPAAEAVAADMHKMMKDALKPDTVVVLPVAPCSPLPLDAPPEAQEVYFKRVQMFSSIASLGGCPSVVIPAGRLKDGAPLAVALISQPRTDLRLLAVAEKLAPIIQEQFARVTSGALERAVQEEEERKAAAEKKRLEEEKQLEKAEKHKAKGNELFAAGQYEKAIQQYSLAIKLYPRSAAYYGNRALVHLKMFNWEAAEADCTSALQHSTADKVAVKALLRRASARRALSNFRGAVADLSQVLALEPNNSDARQERASIQDEVSYYQAQFQQQQATSAGPAGPEAMMGGEYGNGGGGDMLGDGELGPEALLNGFGAGLGKAYG